MNKNIRINYFKPSSISDWNKLSEKNGNILQSTFYDEVQMFFNLSPIYIEYYVNNQLIAGVKLYYYESKKFPWLYKQLSLFGEFLFDNENKTILKSEIDKEFSAEIKQLFRTKKITFFKYSSYYGDEPLNIDNSSLKRQKWGINYIDIKQSIEEIQANMHSKHRNMINRAKKENLAFHEISEIQILIDLIEKTYLNQTKDMPNKDYIRYLYEKLSVYNKCGIFIVKSGEVILSAALVQLNGKVADYTFGGNIKNNFGAGQFLQYNVILKLKELGYEKYYLGQVADNYDETNKKFSVGISRFKNRFGGKNKEGISIEIVLKKLNYKIWKLMIRLIKRK